MNSKNEVYHVHRKPAHEISLLDLGRSKLDCEAEDRVEAEGRAEAEDRVLRYFSSQPDPDVQ